MRGLWAALRRQPVRSYLYGVLIQGEALAVSYGVVSQEQGVLWLAVGAAVLLVPAAELARAAVTPVARPRDNDGEPLVPAVAAAADLAETVDGGPGDASPL